MTSEVEIIAIVNPAEGKEDRVAEGLREIATRVQDTEKDCLKYQVFEQTNSLGTKQFVVIERYVSMEAFESHLSTESFRELARTIEEEQLLASPLDIKELNPIAGFRER